MGLAMFDTAKKYIFYEFWEILSVFMYFFAASSMHIFNAPSKQHHISPQSSGGNYTLLVVQRSKLPTN